MTTIGTAGKLDVPTMVAQLVAADRSVWSGAARAVNQLRGTPTRG